MVSIQSEIPLLPGLERWPIEPLPYALWGRAALLEPGMVINGITMLPQLDTIEMAICRTVAILQPQKARPIPIVKAPLSKGLMPDGFRGVVRDGRVDVYEADLERVAQYEQASRVRGALRSGLTLLFSGTVQRGAGLETCDVVSETTYLAPISSRGVVRLFGGLTRSTDVMEVLRAAKERVRQPANEPKSDWGVDDLHRRRANRISRALSIDRADMEGGSESYR